MPFGPSHKVILSIARTAIKSFFREVCVINEDNVPKDGPVLVLIHYWAKASLFANPVARAILLDAGNIPVNRRSKDNQSMFKGTFDALAADEVVALFPEGTSYTEPRIMQVKDGASWAALEYTKWAASEEGVKKGARPLSVIPVGLVYTNKSKYRSGAIMEFGKAIDLESLAKDFASSNPDVAKSAVKKLTKAIEDNLLRLTVNANDWEILYASRMARDLLWEQEGKLSLVEFVAVSQMLVDIFTYSNPCKSYTGVKEALLRYSSLLKAAKLTNSAISSLPLPRTLDPSHPTPLPSRLSTLAFLVFSTVACIGPLPFFAIPLLINAPAYITSRFGANLVIDEEETQAQNKIVFGFLLTAASYGFIFWTVWAFFWRTPLGAVLASSAVYLLYTYYLRTIDDFYARSKKLMAAWRVLIGVWGPRRWDMSVTALKPWTIPEIPPPNPWIDRPLTPVPTNTTIPAAPSTSNETGSDKPKKRSKKPASRSLIRHVLRARTEASRALAAFLEELEVMSPRVRVSAHLGHPEGSFEEGYVSGLSSDTSEYLDAGISSAGTSTPGSSSSRAEKKAYLEGREIINFFRARGAKIAHQKSDVDWAAAASSSEAEETAHKGHRAVHSDPEEVVWVSPAA
ncbi:hypothetical protein FRB99_006322 [Tulasnella sp. 403]|nr:hypothetical protein FRB99_006322 [Tulasnella sp. 403]